MALAIIPSRNVDSAQAKVVTPCGSNKNLWMAPITPAVIPTIGPQRSPPASTPSTLVFGIAP